MTIKLYSLKLLKAVWQDVACSIKDGYRPDYLTGHFVKFFCQERATHHPTLSVTPNKGLMVMGQKGLGKTFNFIVYRRIQNKFGGKGMRIHSVSEIVSQVKILGESFVKELIDTPELMIDDLGTESLLNNYGDSRNIISEILMQRYSRFQLGLCITHCTTNLNVELLKQTYDSILVDRMKEMFILIKATGESYRR